MQIPQKSWNDCEDFCKYFTTKPQKSRPGSSFKLHAGAAYYNDWSTLAQTSVLK